jgi:hypothetical protein
VQTVRIVSLWLQPLAIYDATQDLARLCSTPNFRYRAASRVIRILSFGGQEKAVEIDASGRHEVASATALVLAAGTLGTTALVLGSSGAIGKRLRLLTNPVAALVFLVPSQLGKPLPKSRFSLGQLSYRLEIGEGSDYATGVFYTADTPPASYLAENMPVSRHAALRRRAAYRGRSPATYPPPAAHRRHTIITGDAPMWRARHSAVSLHTPSWRRRSLSGHSSDGAGRRAAHLHA